MSDPPRARPAILAEMAALRLAAILPALALLGLAYPLVDLRAPLAFPSDLPAAVSHTFPRAFALLATYFVLVATFAPRRAWPLLVAAASLAYVASVSLPCLAYTAVTSLVLYPWLRSGDAPTLKQSRWFWVLLPLVTVLLPKLIEARPYWYDHGAWPSVHEIYLQGLSLRYAYFWYERRKGVIPPHSFAEHLVYLAFVPQVTGILNHAPSEFATRWGYVPGFFTQFARGIALIVAKITVLTALRVLVLPRVGYSLGYDVLVALPRWRLWLAIVADYVAWYVLLSCKFDLMATLFRAFGLGVEDNFRNPLLATSPGELWRRWNIYNRRFLLRFVYFPLGGNRTGTYRNVMLTFMASALVLHSGWFGSPWWIPDVSALTDWLVYFAGQGVLVCMSLAWRDRVPSAPPRTFHAAFRAVGGIAFTTGSTAWLHLLLLTDGQRLPLAAGYPGLSVRVGLMLRALGIG